MYDVYTIFYKELKGLLYNYKDLITVSTSLVTFPIFIIYLLYSNNISFPLQIIILLYSCLMTSTIASQIAYNSMQFEKYNKTLEILLSTGMPRGTIIIGKLIIPIIASILVPIFIIISFTVIVSGANNFIIYTIAINMNWYYLFALSFLSGLLTLLVVFTATILFRNGRSIGNIVSVTIYWYTFYLVKPNGDYIRLITFSMLILLFCTTFTLLIAYFSKKITFLEAV